MLLAPQNLVTKKIGGQKVKARDLLNYFKSYVDVFNSEELPNPMTILQVSILILLLWVDGMTGFYIADPKLYHLHGIVSGSTELI